MPFAVPADEGERLVFGDVTILLRVPAEATGGAFSFFEEVPPLVDTPLHVHEHEDELFYVLEGEHVFRVGDEERLLGPGGTWRILGGVPHTAQAGPDGAVVVDTFAPVRADWDVLDVLAPTAPRWP